MPDIEVDDYVRWLGKQRPVGLAWMGLALLELAAAIFVVCEAYIRVDQYLLENRPNYEDVVLQMLKDNAGVIQR